MMLIRAEAFEDGIAEGQAGPGELDLAADDQLRAGLQLLDEKRLVEPHRIRPRPVILEGRLDEHDLLVRSLSRADIADTCAHRLHRTRAKRIERHRGSSV